jgi:tetratricopeptide (TPR) repeat protein
MNRFGTVITILIVSLFCSIGAKSAGFQTSSWNNGAVENLPLYPAVLTFDTPVHLNYIETYHWNYGNGVFEPGTIRIEKENGKQYGPWQATGREGSGGAQNAIWRVDADVDLPAGTYAIIDSDSETWSHNKESGSAGFALLQYDKLDIHNAHISDLCDYAFVLNARGRYQEAENVFDQALEHNPLDPCALSMKGWALLGVGRYQEALDALDASLKNKPDNALVLSNKACALYGMRRCQEALQILDYADRLDPSNNLNKRIRQLAENC